MKSPSPGSAPKRQGMSSDSSEHDASQENDESSISDEKINTYLDKTEPVEEKDLWTELSEFYDDMSETSGHIDVKLAELTNNYTPTITKSLDSSHVMSSCLLSLHKLQ